MAPSDLKSFSAIFNVYKVSLSIKAIPIHSPPSAPRSLLLMESDSRTLFLIRSAEIHTAPVTPSEFLLDDPSEKPKSKCFKVLFWIKSSRKSSSAYPESWVDAMFKYLRLKDGSLMILFKALVAIYALRQLSARFRRSI